MKISKIKIISVRQVPQLIRHPVYALKNTLTATYIDLHCYTLKTTIIERDIGSIYTYNTYFEIKFKNLND